MDSPNRPFMISNVDSGLRIRIEDEQGETELQTRQASEAAFGSISKQGNWRSQ
jgi:hypothetical protein